MLYIIYGEDDFSVKDCLAGIKTDCGGSELGEANTAIFDGAKVQVNELLNACNTISFLAPKRLVIVEGLLGKFERNPKKGGGKKAGGEIKDWETLADHIPNMPESTVLVLADGKIGKTNPLFKKLAPLAEVKQCISPKGPQLQQWVRERVSANGAQISPQAIRLLADNIGSNLWILASEIDKLCLYAGEDRIEIDDIRQLVSYARESNIFTMVDALIERRQKIASKLMHQLLAEGSAPPYLLFMITRQFRQLVQAKILAGQGIPPRTIGEKVGINSDFVLDKTLSQARGYTLSRLEGAYQRLLETDIAIKTGASEGELALDLLVTDLCRN